MRCTKVLILISREGMTLASKDCDARESRAIFQTFCQPFGMFRLTCSTEKEKCFPPSKNAHLIFSRECHNCQGFDLSETRHVFRNKNFMSSFVSGRDAGGKDWIHYARMTYLSKILSKHSTHTSLGMINLTTEKCITGFWGTTEFQNNRLSR